MPSFRPRYALFALAALLAAGLAALPLLVPGRIAHVGLSRIALEGLALPGLTAERLALEFDGFFVSSVEARGVALKGRLDAGGLSLGPLDALIGGGGGSESAWPRLRLNDVRLEIETTEGVETVTASGDETRIALVLSGPLSGKASLALGERISLESPRLNLAYQGEAVEISAFAIDMKDGAGRAAAEIAQGALKAGFNLAWSDKKAAGVAIRLELREPHLAPLTLAGTLSGKAFAGELSDAGRNLVVRLKAALEGANGQGSLAFNTDRLNFKPDGLQPVQLLPGFKEKLTGFQGGLDLDGRLAWSAKGIAGQATLVIDELSGKAFGIRFHRLNGAVAFDRLSPLRTPPGQTLALAGAHAGVPLANGRLSFQLGEDGKLSLESGGLEMAGGTITMKPATFDAEDQALVVLEAKGLDLGKLAQLSGVEGLSVEGLADGSLPLVFDDAGVAIAGGKLAVQDPGWVRWRPAAWPSALQGGGEAVSLMMAALADFRYQALSLDVEGRVGGETRLGFHIKGRNPSLHEGYPLEFNLALSGPLDQVVESALAGWQVPPDIAQRMEEIRAARRN
jgi:hypothetical protein